MHVKKQAGLMLALALFATFGAMGAARAAEFRLGDMVVQSAFAPQSIGAARAGAAYFVIRNQGDAPDRLIGAHTDLSARTELHMHIHENGIMRMREVEGGIVIGAGQTVTLAPGGLHVMLMGLSSPLQAQTSFPLTLTFEKAGNLTIEVMVSDGKRDTAPHTH
jgi:copper(I)-binding protein